MPFYRKKPVVIEAICITEDPTPEEAEEIRSFLGEEYHWEIGSNGLDIHTLEGVMHASPGDFIIRGVEGELYPCKPDIFWKTYEEMSKERERPPYNPGNLAPSRKGLGPLKENEPKLYVVRLWDGFDRYWIDVSQPVSKDEADKIWREKTNNGREKTSYNDIDYYRVFPADTDMMYNKPLPGR